MGAVAGKKGKVMVAAATALDVKQWQADIEVDTEDTTALGADWKSSTVTLLGGSGSLECSWNMGDATGQKALQDAALAGTEVALKLYPNAANYYEGNALITNLSITTPVGGVVTAKFDFTFNGEVSYT